MSEYVNLNKANWDQRAPLHAASAFYDTQAYERDASYLSSVVRFDLPRLGDIAGLRGVHLQCHIGTDTISLSRLGARMTGLDFSPASIAEARALAERSQADVDFVETEVYDAASVLAPNSFDLVFTGIGALCWLPSIERWAATVSALLRPGGRLFIREGHPSLWSLDERHEDSLVIGFPYFERDEPLVWDEASTYADADAVITASVTHEWNHGIGEILTALLDHGMQIIALVEHDSVPWLALPGQMTESDDGEWRLDHDGWRLPLTYTLQAIKRG
jgi:SAM-dependent methyltransferase